MAIWLLPRSGGAGQSPSQGPPISLPPSPPRLRLSSPEQLGSSLYLGVNHCGEEGPKILCGLKAGRHQKRRSCHRLQAKGPPPRHTPAPPAQEPPAPSPPTGPRQEEGTAYVAHSDPAVLLQQPLFDLRPQRARHVEAGAGRALLAPVLEGGAQGPAHHAVHVGGAVHEVKVLTAALYGGQGGGKKETVGSPASPGAHRTAYTGPWGPVTSPQFQADESRRGTGLELDDAQGTEVPGLSPTRQTKTLTPKGGGHQRSPGPTPHYTEEKLRPGEGCCPIQWQRKDHSTSRGGHSCL